MNIIQVLLVNSKSVLKQLILKKSLNQWDTNERITLIQETLEKLKANEL